jgi:hypothetical protein
VRDRFRLEKEDNGKMDLKEMGCVYWLDVIRWRALVITRTKLLAP